MTCSLVEPGTGDKVDVTPPEVTITFPTQDKYLRGSFTLSGTVNDDRSIKSIVVSYQGNSATVTKTVVAAEGKWSVSIPTGTTLAANLAEGRQTISVVVTDESDKSTGTTVPVFVDNIAPTVLVTVPQVYGASTSIVSDYIDIKGEVWDQSPIESVNVSIVGVPGSTKLCSGTYTWSVRLVVSTLAEETFNYMVEVVDRAGNINTYYYHSQDIWELVQALPAGTLFPSMDEIGKLDQNKITTSSGITYGDLYPERLGPDKMLYGNFEKNNNIALPVIQFTNIDTANAITDNILGTQVPINGYVDPGTVLNPLVSGSFSAWIIPFADYPTWPVDSNVNNEDIKQSVISSSISFQIEPRISGSDISSGQYYVKVEIGAEGIDAVSSLTCGFFVDAGAPRIESTVPENNTLISY
ncbi:MAG: Ig-like domain-containing protein, partial [Candidatus Pacearchaeota archaeon]|nr:Ig-like domain-containing protein [Candidatus Pacearchaeota archaeon]